MPWSAKSFSSAAISARFWSLIGLRPPKQEVVLPHLLEALARDAPAAGHVLQERHHVLGLLRTSEGEDQQGVVRLHVGVTRRIHAASVERPTMRLVLDSYRRVLARPGALAFSSAALVARLPISMVGLGIVLLVEERTGSYGLAGTVSAVFVLAEAAFAVAARSLGRPLRPVARPAAGHLGVRRGPRADDAGRRAGLAAGMDLRLRGDRRRGTPPGRRERPHPLVPPARRPGREADGLRPGGGARRGRLRGRPRAGHPAGDQLAPGRGPDRRAGQRRRRHLRVRGPAAYRTARRSQRARHRPPGDALAARPDRWPWSA